MTIAFVWGFVRVRGPNAAQRQALATMNRPPPEVRRNAFPALWLMPYDIPASETPGVFEQDRSAIERAIARRQAIPASAAEGRYPRATLDDETDALCRASATCLAEVEADPGAAAAYVERHAALIRRAEALAAYDGIRSGFGNRGSSPLPPYQLARAPTVAYALAFVQGRRAEAFDGTCRAISTWRRLGSRSDQMVGRLIGSAYASKSYGLLFMQMLARVPRDEALPASCGAAFSATTPDENTLCPAFRGEFEEMRDALADAPNDASLAEDARVPRWLLPVLYSVPLSEADAAMLQAPMCSPQADRRIAADEAYPADGEVPSLVRPECVGNVVGCLLSRAAVPAPGAWFARVQDANASLRLVSEILAYRAEASPEDTLSARLEARHARIGSAQRKVEVDAAAGRVRLGGLVGDADTVWEAPLPPSLLPPATSPR